MKFEVSITKIKFFAILGAILVLAGAIAIYAYGSNPANPAVFGHTANEIEGVCKTDGTGCPAGLGGGESYYVEISSPGVKLLDQTKMQLLCGDDEGCLVTIGLKFTHGAKESGGPYKFFISTKSDGTMTWNSISKQNQLSGLSNSANEDNNNVVYQFVHLENVCFLEDSDGVNVDNKIGLSLRSTTSVAICFLVVEE